jgi:hypothetical protein
MDDADDAELLALPGYATPEEAATADYSPGAEVRVVWVQHFSQNVAHVLIDTVPAHPMLSQCVLCSDGFWREAGSGNY